MQLDTAGKMNKQVAGDLGISEITVKCIGVLQCGNIGCADPGGSRSDGRRDETQGVIKSRIAPLYSFFARSPMARLLVRALTELGQRMMRVEKVRNCGHR
jgi:FixJ family two-component response regulator